MDQLAWLVVPGQRPFVDRQMCAETRPRLIVHHKQIVPKA